VANGSISSSRDDVRAAADLRSAYDILRAEIGKVIVGQEEVVEHLLIALLSRGHCLLVGVPGLAKTLLIRTLSEVLDLSFSRIQFTPDLMPSDITGTEIIEEKTSSGTKSFKFIRGPVFANIVLADEINRTPPKTQSALLEAMQEHRVTAAGRPYTLEEPFFVLATQNPIEQEGTYPLPEAQLDRFMFKVLVDYPEENDEVEIVRRTTTPETRELQKMLRAEDILSLQAMVRRVPAGDHVIRYAMALVRKTRVSKPGAPSFIKDWVNWGAGPRATQFLILGGKARAIMQGRYFVTTEDVRYVARPVLRHRVLTNFNAEAEGVTSDKIVDMLIQDTPDKASPGLDDPRLPAGVVPAANG
jgi:MoxR-like ATPase